MQPNTRQKKDPLAPKWRHFHPQAKLIMKNPFNEDIEFQVADEHNVPYTYRLPRGKVCELPGGAVATLGLKKVIDRLIGENNEVVRTYEPSVRQKYEAQVIVKVIDPPQLKQRSGPDGPIDLAQAEEDAAESDAPEQTEDQEVQTFPDARPHQQPSAPPLPIRDANRRYDPEAPELSHAGISNEPQVIEQE